MGSKHTAAAAATEDDGVASSMPPLKRGRGRPPKQLSGGALSKRLGRCTSPGMNKGDQKEKVAMPTAALMYKGSLMTKEEYEAIKSEAVESTRNVDGFARACASATRVKLADLRAACFTRHGAGASPLPCFVKHARTGAKHAFMLKKSWLADNSIHTAESAVAAVAEQGGRVFVLEAPRGPPGRLVGAEHAGHVRLRDPPATATSSTFDGDAGSKSSRLDAHRLAVGYGLPRPAGLWTPDDIMKLVSEYTPLRPLIDSPWHEGLDAQWRPGGTFDPAHLAHASSEFGCTSRYTKEVHTLKMQLRKEHPEIEAFEKRWIIPMVDDVWAWAMIAMRDLAEATLNDLRKVSPAIYNVAVLGNTGFTKA